MGILQARVLEWVPLPSPTRQHMKQLRHHSANKGPSSQSYGFFSSMYGCESWTIKKTEHRKIDALELWCWIRFLRVPWTSRRSNRLILCHPLLLLPSIFPSIRVFSNESVLHIRWPKYWSFSFSISPSNEYSELISLKIDWFDLLAVQGTLKSLFQHHSSKASILQC